MNYRLGMVRAQHFGNADHGPVLRRRWDESGQETGPPNAPAFYVAALFLVPAIEVLRDCFFYFSYFFWKAFDPSAPPNSAT